MKSLEEMQRFFDEGVDSRRRHRVYQLRAQQAEGQKVSELQADPRFEAWGRHIEAIRDSYQRRLEAATAKLVFKPLSHDDYVSAFADLQANRAAVNALDQALLVAKTVIEKGEAAVLTLKTLDIEEKKGR